jgi:apolipoprotein N-acyltransferase
MSRLRALARALNPGPRWLALSALLGAFSVFGFAPFHLYSLPMLGLALQAWLWHRARNSAHAAALGFGFGLGFFLTGTSWIYVSMHDFGSMPAPVAALATFIFCGYFALLPAAAGWLFRFPRVSAWMRFALLLPAAWTLTEWTRSWTFTGFPWLALGYSQSPHGALSGFAPLVGVYGVSLAAALSAGLLCHLMLEMKLRGRMTRGSWSRVVTLLVLWGTGEGLQHIAWTKPLGEPVAVSLIQGNIKLDMKWQPEWIQASLERYLRLTLAAHGRLILLPETAIPLFKDEVPPEYLEALASHARTNGGDVLLGIPEAVKERGHTRYYNAVISLGSHPPQTYRKYHLVPFGDYFPHWGVLNWIMSALDIPMSDFARGDPYQPPMAANGQRIAVDICYEDAFGEEIIRPLPEATMLANFTNDAWWGESWASDQHLQIAQMRAQETGRYMLRATNTGVTAIIDELGHITAVAPQHMEATLEGTAQGFTGSTPYVVWGNWPVLAICFGVVGFSFALRWTAQRYKARASGESKSTP